METCLGWVLSGGATTDYANNNAVEKVFQITTAEFDRTPDLIKDKQAVVFRSSAAVKYGIINYEGNNKKFLPGQNNLSNKRDDNTKKMKWIALSRSFTIVKSLEWRFNH